MCLGEVELAQALENWCKNWCQIIILSILNRLGTLFSVVFDLIDLIITTTEPSGYYCYLYFTKEETECSVQFSHSVMFDFATPWTAALQAFLSNTNSWSLLKLMSIEPEMPSNHLSLCRPLHLRPSIFPSIRVSSNESAFHIRWPKDWSFSFNVNPSNEYSGLFSFRMDWLDLLAVQGTLKSLPNTTVWKYQFVSNQPSLWQEYTEGLYNKDLNDPDNHHGVITQHKDDQCIAQRLMFDLMKIIALHFCLIIGDWNTKMNYYLAFWIYIHSSGRQRRL